MTVTIIDSGESHIGNAYKHLLEINKSTERKSKGKREKLYVQSEVEIFA